MDSDNSAPLPDTPLPTPQEMIAHLNRFVRGQERAKRDLAMAVYQHYVGARYAEMPGAKFGDLERQHILLLGPTGSGKTYLVRRLSEFLGVPMSVASATSFAETGYVGDHVDSLVSNLLSLTNWDVLKAQRGIVFLDEIDKIKRGHQTGRDVSGEGVQAALLTLLDGKETIIKSGDRSAHIDVSKILFVCTGAFVDLAPIIRQRLHRDPVIGFGSSPAHDAESSLADPLDHFQTADLAQFGMLPELIGRFSTISALRPLSRTDLKAILLETEDSVLAKQQTMFRLHGIELEFAPDALDALAERAFELNTGARGLRRVVLNSVDAIDWRLPELANEGVTNVVVTADSVQGAAEPELVKGPKLVEEPLIHEIRRTARLPAPVKPVFTTTVKGANISDTRGWTAEQIRQQLESTKDQHLDWNNTTGSARKWWSAFEAENEHRLPLVLRLAEELRNRKATITEFFLAYVYSNTDNIQANLSYLDYTRLKKEEERRKRQAKDKPPEKGPA